MERYNGYTNYPTWLIAAYIGNDEEQYNYWIKKAGECETLDELANTLAEEFAADTYDNMDIINQLIGFAISFVAWEEVAESIAEDME